MILLLFGCHAEEKPADTTSRCDVSVRVEGKVTGAVVGQPDLVVAALDASDWRFGDADPLSEVVSPGGDGAFTLCLDADVALTDVYTKAFVAAWRDLDADERYDAKAEALCEQAGGPYLFYGATAAGMGWTVGVDRGSVADRFSPLLDGGRCQ